MKSARTQILNLVEVLIQQMMTGDLQEVIREMPKPGYISEDVWNAAMAICRDNLPSRSYEKTRQVLFILDDNMYFWSMRYEYYKLAKLCMTFKNLISNNWKEGWAFIKDYKNIKSMEAKLSNCALSTCFT